MTRAYRTEIPPTPTQRFFAILVVAHAAAAVALCFLRGLYLIWFRNPETAGRSWLNLFSVMTVVVFGVLGFAVAACLLTWALDYCWRWLKWALTGVWLVYSEEIDDIESA